jgi:hypothetical protein
VSEGELVRHTSISIELLYGFFVIIHLKNGAKKCMIYKVAGCSWLCCWIRCTYLILATERDELVGSVVDVIIIHLSLR